MSKKITQITSTILAFLFAFGVFTTTNSVFAATLSATVYAGNSIPTSTINYDGHSIGNAAYIIKDGVRYDAYCIDPLKHGAESHPNGQYDVKIDGANYSPQVATVLHNSPPYVTKASIW